MHEINTLAPGSGPEDEAPSTRSPSERCSDIWAECMEELLEDSKRQMVAGRLEEKAESEVLLASYRPPPPEPTGVDSERPGTRW